ncbi:hypothetical protein [Aeromonas veronii]|uniref:hypothetical protein n=1 Tax=Aeromonas veronii TaxID=654 RepID=UPI0033080B4E|nr:hypothetical protein [Aeromonas veronii]
MVRNQKSKILNKQKNKLRGLIAKARSNAFKKDLNLDPSYVYCRGLKEIFLDSRTKLLPHEYESFLNWVDEQSRTVASDISTSKPGYADLAGVISYGISRCDLETELHWVTQLLKLQSHKINDLIHFNKKINELILSEEIDTAISLIETFDLKHGSSFYTHNIRVALENLNGGLEKQKAYVAEVRKRVKGGLLSFISYYVSIRNENKTTISKYREDLNFRLERHKYYDDTVKQYLRFKLTGDIKLEEAYLTDIIFVEQSHHLFDLYNTYIDILQVIVKTPALHHFNKNLLSFCKHLIKIQDPIIEKIKSRIENTSPNLPARNVSMSDNLLTGNVYGAIKSWHLMSITEKSDPWQFIYFSFLLAELNNRTSKYSLQSPVSVPYILSDLINSNSSSAEYNLDRIKKIALNFPCVKFINGVYEFSDQILNKRCNESYKFNDVGLYSGFYGIEDHVSDPSSLCSHSITNMIWDASFKSSDYKNPNIPINISNTFKAISFIENGSPEKVIKLILDSGKINYGNLWPINLEFLLSASANVYDNDKSVRIIATEGVREKIPFPIHAIDKFLNDTDWMKYKDVDDQVLSCVAIHLLWRKNDSVETASMLRFAIRQCLRRNNIRVPSELIKLKRETPLRAWKYFFREVCKNQFIDQLLHGSNELLVERQKICAYMSNIDYEFIDSYEKEMADIASSLAIDNGKKIIDRTRIHVDTDALKRWAIKELTEDYRRYHDLLDVNVKASFENEFNEIFSDILQKGGGATKWKTLNKDSEADMVFISLLARLSDEFLNSPEYGLDFYLSKRVRHQSFIGLIRGPLEFGHLITTKENSGEYDRNEHVLSRLANLPEESIKLVDLELKKFSKKFDDLLENTKNSYFQINGTDNPKGLINLEIQEQAVFLLKVMTHKVNDFANFIDIAVSVFWTSLSISLSKVRAYISQNLKQSIVLLFDELALNLKRDVKSSDIEFHRLILEIKTCATEVQRELDLAAQWFSRNNIDDITQSTFDAHQLLEIAIDSTLKCHQSFHPKITKHVISENDYLLDTSTLVFVHDVMFVALGNIYRHSGVEAPNVSLTAELTEQTFSICVVSDFSSKNTQQSLDKLNEIRQLIKEKRFERRTRKEGGSGLLKIAAVALQDPLGKIEFDVTENSFILKVTFRLLMATVPLERMHG